MVAEFPSGQGSRLPLPVVRADAQQARRRLSHHGVCALGDLLVPAVLFPTGLLLLREAVSGREVLVPIFVRMEYQRGVILNLIEMWALIRESVTARDAFLDMSRTR